jgi:hypothetical protein
LIGDARNDEHLIICQLHLLFIQFHNKVVDYVLSKSPRLTGGDLLEEARRVVRWHYQWIVVHDFLERLVGEELARRVLQPGADGEPPTVCLQFFHSRGDPFMPVESRAPSSAAATAWSETTTGSSARTCTACRSCPTPTGRKRISAACAGCPPA